MRNCACANFDLWHSLRFCTLISEKIFRRGIMTDDKHLKAPWYRLPKLVAMPQLVEIRNQLRRENLHDTEEPALEKRTDASKPDLSLIHI